MDREVHDKFLRTPENRRLYQQEKLLVDATELLALVMERKNMSRAELARAIGKSKAFVTQVLRGNQNMTLRTLADLFGAMHHEVVVQALPFAEDRVPDLDYSSPWAGYRFEGELDNTSPARGKPAGSLLQRARRGAAESIPVLPDVAA